MLQIAAAAARPRSSRSIYGRDPQGRIGPRLSRRAIVAGQLPRYDGAMAESEQQPLAQQLEEIGVQLDWVRDYL